MEKTENGMVKVVGVRFRTAGKIYYFDPGEFELVRGNHVIVETARGIEYGFVVGPPMEVEEKNITQPLKAVLRISTEEDDIRVKKNREREREAFWICRERIQKRGLEMKLIDAEYTFDNSKVLFYFTADGRVDFRELVKDLAGVFRTRIELRQVGVRDETKILGGYGSCGRPLCCHTWLSDFVPVSIKMAKEQNLSLNPGKISGVCGRLMCCLKNEAETYEELNKSLPHPGDEVESADGLNGLVESVNILRQTARIIVEVDDEKELHEYNVSDLTILRRRKRGTSRPSMQKNTQPQKTAKDNKEGKEGREGREKKEGREGKGNRENRGGRDNNKNRDSREQRESADGRNAGEAREGKGSSENSGKERARKENSRNRRERRSDRRQDRRQNRDEQQTVTAAETGQAPQTGRTQHEHAEHAAQAVKPDSVRKETSHE
jgi:cell fate regulator YaaT (PSP1 superfamily)